MAVYSGVVVRGFAGELLSSVASAVTVSVGASISSVDEGVMLICCSALSDNNNNIGKLPYYIIRNKVAGVNNGDRG